MDNSEAAVQRNTPHKAAQDSGSEAGMTGGGACTECRTAAQLARKRTRSEAQARTKRAPVRTLRIGLYMGICYP